MTTTLDDAVAMVRTCRTRSVKLGVGYDLRQHSGLREARRLVAEGVLGMVALAHSQWGFGVRGQDRPPPCAAMAMHHAASASSAARERSRAQPIPRRR